MMTGKRIYRIDHHGISLHTQQTQIYTFLSFIRMNLTSVILHLSTCLPDPPACLTYSSTAENIPFKEEFLGTRTQIT